MRKCHVQTSMRTPLDVAYWRFSETGAAQFAGGWGAARPASPSGEAMRAFTSKTLQWRGLRSGESGERCDLCMLDCVIHPMSTMRTQSPSRLLPGYLFGSHSLGTVFWGGVGGFAVWLAAMYIAATMVPFLKAMLWVYFFVFMFAWWAATWKSADRYAGPVVWQRSAKTVVVVTALLVASLVLYGGLVGR